jgi:hypothetical protein
MLIHTWVHWGSRTSLLSFKEVAMTLSNMIVRETADNEFAIGMLLTSGTAEQAEAIFDNKFQGTIAVELPVGTEGQQDFQLKVKVRCFLPN